MHLSKQTNKCIHLSIFSNSFILVRVVVDPEPVLGMLGVRWELVLYGSSIHRSHIHTWVQFSETEILVCFRRWDEETLINTQKTCKTQPYFVINDSVQVVHFPCYTLFLK